MPYSYDIIVFGGGIAGLWLTNILLREGYDVILIESDRLGCGQTLASQGMIHGGQKYVLEGIMTAPASAILAMPARWQASLEGRGEIDLAGVEVLSDTQVMWPAASMASRAAVWAAARLVNARTRKLAESEYPEILKQNAPRGPVYSLPEKVLDVRSLVTALASNLKGRLLRGRLDRLSANGEVVVSGEELRAQFIVFTAGAGNETALVALGSKAGRAQRRPLRQVMVRPLPSALFGHCIGLGKVPGVTVTSHPGPSEELVWYLGGAVAEQGAAMDEVSALQHAKRELQQIFPALAWDGMEWATWYGDRAEPFDANGSLPPGPHVDQQERTIIGWPTKLTFAPALADRVRDLLREGSAQQSPRSERPPLPVAEIGRYPWETAQWQKLA
jgi:glycine/D-amino acid oxidase-like deaminating enzyme